MRSQAAIFYVKFSSAPSFERPVAVRASRLDFRVTPDRQFAFFCDQLGHFAIFHLSDWGSSEAVRVPRIRLPPVVAP